MKVYFEKIRPKSTTIYHKFRIDNIKIQGITISTLLSLYIIQVLIVWIDSKKFKQLTKEKENEMPTLWTPK